MERWRGKSVLITGASSGIGLATAEALAKFGLKVIGCARNVQTLVQLNARLGDNQIDAISCDLTNEEEVCRMLSEIKQKYGTLNALINSAGMALKEPLASGTQQGWKRMLDLNIVALSVCTREALKLMEPGKIAGDGGHVININSYIGHHVHKNPSVQFYSATKHMVTALTDALRKDCQAKNIRVTSLSPGVVETEFADRAFGSDPTEVALSYYTQYKCLQAKDVAGAIVYILSVPPYVNIDELTMTPHQQALI
ncbi:Dehydrogenase/reductase SDR family member 11 [Hypsibius exemplaris]|uniref:Dehydrogenase/reductase SDR family member 11 n=1 Tax=Hypsibius exemplaris TaxID=2072580 RepID=A0A1W0WFA9_HYPEX|nr:Dehydrogenase/reductase SDR family member 11 [Hypsibius exemplaris]